MTDLVLVNTAVKSQTDEFRNLMILYSSALKELETKISIINDEFKYTHQYNPIEHVKSRLKTPESIVRKMERKGYEINYSNIAENIKDIAGIRIVCSFVSDIYTIIDMIDKYPDIEILERKDYISKPKKNGYSSYHLIVSVPISFSTGLVYVKAEIQIRTIAMDFWASLEHKINYKYDGDVPTKVIKDLKNCAKMVSQLDNKMLSLNQLVTDINKEDLQKEMMA